MINCYTVYFEIYGKRLKTTVFAESEEKAKEAIKAKINFHKVEEYKSKNDIFSGKEIDDLMNILGVKK